MDTTSPEKAPPSPPNEEQANTQQEEKKTGSHAGGFKSFTRIFTYARPVDYAILSVALVAALAAGAAVALLNLVLGQFVTILNSYVVGASTPERFRADAAAMCLRFVYLGVGRLACTYLYAALSTYSGHHVVRNLRAAYLRAALSQEVAFFDRGAAGSVSMQATSNGKLIQSGIGEKLGTFAAAMGTFVAAFAIAFASQWKLTFIVLCIAPSMLLVIGFVAAVDSGVETEILGVQARAAAFAETILGSARNVHAFGLRARLMRRFDVYLDEVVGLGRKKNWLYGVMFSGEYTIIYLGIGLSFWQGLKMITEGEVSDVGVVFTVLLCVINAALSFTTVAPSSVAFSRASSAAAELFTLIDRVSEINPFDDSGEKPTDTVGALQIEGISFAYPTRPGVHVLKDFTLDIPAGKVTALVGPSGSGKSTIIGLIERWYNPESGTIKLDGRPIDTLNLNWLRTNARLVQQEPVLFNGTVFDNIASGLVGTPLERASPAEQRAAVESAARTAFAHDFVSQLPDGYDTRIGERGGLLSGGQKQRVAIARSIVSDPKILLLDEATSALDPHAEAIVQRALDAASRERTTVVIAHRLATIRAADNIVVMAGGRIVEQGTHEELVARGEDEGTYARMVRAQTLVKDAADEGRDGDDATTSTSDGKAEAGPAEEGGAAAAAAAAADGEEPAPTQSIVRYATAERQHMESLKGREDFGLYKKAGVVRTIWRLMMATKQLKWWYVFLAVDCLLATSVIPAQIALLAQTLDVFNTTDPAAAQKNGNFLASMFIVLSAGAFIAYFIMGWTTNTIAQEINRQMRRDMLDLFLRQDLRFFDREENTVGALTSRLDSEPQAALELMGFNIAIVIIAFLTVIASSIFGIAFSWKLGLVAFFAGIPPLMAAGYVRIRLESRMDVKADKRYSKSASIASEAILAIRTVSSLAIERVVLDKYTRELDDAIVGLTPSLFGMFTFYAFTQAVEYFILALGFWYGSRLMSFGEVTFYEFFVSFYGVFFAGQQAGIMFTYSSSFTKGLHAVNYYFWLRGLEPTIRETDDNRDKGPRDQVSSMDLQGVRFSYPLRPDAQVLRGVSLEVLPGKFVALVGASGCGKSTVMALLERFYDPMRGSIRIDGADDLRRLNPRLYRRHVSLVQQEPTLYPGSIRENVAFGVDVADEEVEGAGAASEKQHASDEAIEAALRAANAWDFVCSLPEGLGTACGTSGSQLSGGQRQRIAIARALIRQPRVLLLDEATSALDTESERVVQGALAAAARTGGRITVAVAHRLSTVRDADLICVFYAGRIEEAGTHDELLAKGGMYAKMCEGQSLDRKV
ncbi:hypothetical protein GGTG_07492 [Gaeumannomyces tritici R3-111a-1]|uniref:Leptomycin B resistance protein pmd1 n=1 Tax=Gaeumannomyces tritici (strain R3-111a-1) TaxID=644352 RepID=J3P1U4_GAET3|nr:hypothetical protein GGTG_07492 [Gaeumannomyces tritici R3-111a-1]EJT73636.1 hypothetical protein GGTG_07492 [Gaeumannomyces tritici R3-111a-1]